MKFIAHRGYSHCFPENSLEAFKAVINHPCNGTSLIGIELDVHLTADNVIPVMHEVEVRSIDGSMIPVAQCSFEQLSQLYSLQYKNTRPEIPDINAVLTLIDHQTELCFEIKRGTYNLKQFTDCFCQALTHYQPTGDVVITSFSMDILEFVKPYLANLDVKYGFIFEQPTALSTTEEKVLTALDFLHPCYTLLFTNPELFSAHTLPVRCWTVNDIKTVQSLIDLSNTLPIDAIMTDDIDLAAIFADE